MRKLFPMSSATPRPVFVASCLVVLASLTLGGATRSGYLGDAIAQLLALPLLLLIIWRLLEPDTPRPARSALWLVVLLFLGLLITLAPMPASLWSRLPRREAVVAAYDLIGLRPAWPTTTMSVNASWLSILSVLPAVTTFLCVVMFNSIERRRLSLVLLGFGIVSVFLGLAQLAQGPASPWRFFEVTNTTEAVGYFANRNHFAALLYSLTLFAAAWLGDPAAALGAPRAGQSDRSPKIISVLTFSTVLVLLLAAQAMARSRAGLGLTMVALAGSFALVVSSQSRAMRVASKRALLAAGALAVMLVANFALYRILDRLALDPLTDGRVVFSRQTLSLAQAYMPLGTGLGTFVPVYAHAERLEDAIANTFANHAHNDFLELWLETGMVGFVAVGIFLLWLIRYTIALYRPGQPPGIDLTLRRSAALVIVLLLAHSFVDYPLRTSAMMTVFAISCAFLVPPPSLRISGDAATASTVPSAKDAPRQATGDNRPILHTQPSIPLRTEAPTPPQTQRQSAQLHPGTLLGEGIEWPDAWRRPNDRQSAPHTASVLPEPDKPKEKQ